MTPAFIRSVDFCICDSPADLPSIQTFVAKNKSSRTLPASMISPTIISERRYMGDESITLPPLASSRSTISLRVAISSEEPATSNTSQVPSPTTGIDSSVPGIGRVNIFSVSEKERLGENPSAIAALSTSRRFHFINFTRAPMWT